MEKPVEAFWLAEDPLTLEPIAAPEIKPPATPGLKIIREVATQTGVPLTDILSASRKAPVVAARHAAIKRVRSELGYSYPQIGQLFGRDHSSIIWACRGGRKEDSPRALCICGRRLAA